MAGSGGAVRVVGDQRRAMTACPSGAGYLCPCGESPPIFATRHGGGRVPSTGGESSTFRGAAAKRPAPPPPPPPPFCYAPRRVECAEHGVVVEHIPWSDGKRPVTRPVTCAMMGFLARWARRLSWRETARAFQTSWEAVYRSVEWFVQW